MSRDFCAVVETNCEAPPAYRSGLGSYYAPASTKIATKCYVCGEHVCTACSRVGTRGLSKRKRRLCLNCVETEKPRG